MPASTTCVVSTVQVCYSTIFNTLQRHHPLHSSEDDGMMAWNSVEAQNRVDIQSIHINVVRTRSWGLLHQPGSLTYAHHDAAGQHTWVLNICGHKFWLLFTLKEEYARGSEEEQNTALLNIFKSDKMLIEDALGSVPENFSTPLPFEAYVDIHLVVIEPGSLLHVFISDLSH